MQGGYCCDCVGRVLVTVVEKMSLFLWKSRLGGSHIDFDCFDG